MSTTQEKSPPRHYLGLCAIAKNETPFLREWVAYHHYIGFEKLYVYDNESDVPIRETLREFTEKGVVTVRDMPGIRMQRAAYEDCLARHGHEFEWLAFFDLDEFLCLKKERDARILLRDYEDYSGLALNWDVFSSSGHLGRPSGMVLEDFRQSLGYSSYCKSIVRPRTVRESISPYHFWYTSGCAVNSDGVPALGPFIPVACDQACLNHYSYRSQQDYEEKIQKGSAAQVKNPRSFDKFYRQAASPFTERADILPMAAEVKKLLDAGAPGMRQSITLEETYTLDYGSIAALLGKFFRLGQPDMAETLFALCFKRFSEIPNFYELGVTLCRKTGKSRRALALMRKKMLLSPPGNDDYKLYLDCLADLSLREEAVQIAQLLLHTALYANNDELLAYIEDYARRHTMHLEDNIKVRPLQINSDNILILFEK